MDQKISELLSEKLTPMEIRNKEFKKAMWGYTPQEVIEFLDTLSKAWERMLKTQKELNEKIRLLQAEQSVLRVKEQEIEQLRKEANEEAKRLREKADEEAKERFKEMQTKADEIRLQTEEWLTSVISEVEEAQKWRSNFISSFKARLDECNALIERTPEDGAVESQLAKFIREKASQPSKNN